MNKHTKSICATNFKMQRVLQNIKHSIHDSGYRLVFAGVIDVGKQLVQQIFKNEFMNKHKESAGVTNMKMQLVLQT